MNHQSKTCFVLNEQANVFHRRAKPCETNILAREGEGEVVPLA